MRTTRAGLRYLVPLGRVLFAFIFLLTIKTHFAAQTVAYAGAMGVPAPSVLVPLSGILAIAGGLSVALGYRARIGAWLLVVFLVPVTLWMHAFWRFADPMTAQMQLANFLKNMSMLGAALMLTWFGSGPISLDRRPAPAGRSSDRA